jgi:hypothetical protein
VLRGYTSAANDGGEGEINCNGGAGIPSSVIHLKDLYIHNGGSSTIVSLTNSGTIKNCRVANTSGSGLSIAISVVSQCLIQDCGTGVSAASAGGLVCNNQFRAGGVRNFTNAINTSAAAVISRNTFSMGNTGNAIYVNGLRPRIMSNSILASSSTGKGIVVNGASNSDGLVVENNIVEGFSGTGGVGIDFGSATNHPSRFAGNACYNNTTNYANLGVADDIENIDNEVLGASPFAKSGSDTFANRFVYFAPVDTGNIRGGAIQ